MEDITASNPDFKDQTDGLNALFRDYANSIIRGASYNAFQEMMRPFLKFQGTDVEVEGLLLSATVSNISENWPEVNRKYFMILIYNFKIISQVPQLASNIYRWVTNHFNVTTQQMETYNDQMPDDVITDDSLPDLEMSSDDEDNIMNRVDH